MDLGIAKDSHGFPRVLVYAREFIRFLWIPTNSCELIRIPMDCHGFQWLSMNRYGLGSSRVLPTPTHFLRSALGSDDLLRFQWIPLGSNAFLSMHVDSFGSLLIPILGCLYGRLRVPVDFDWFLANVLYFAMKTCRVVAWTLTSDGKPKFYRVRA